MKEVRKILGIPFYSKEVRGHDIQDPPSTIKNPANWMIEAIKGRGGSDINGVSVNEKTTMGLASVWRCVALLSQGVAGLPFKVYRSVDDEDQELVSGHAASMLFNKRPSNLMTSFTFRELMMMNVLLNGNGVAIIQRGSNFEPEEIYPIHWDNVIKIEVRGGRLWYNIRHMNKENWYDQDYVFHVKGQTSNGIMGLSVLEYHRYTLGLDISNKQFGAKQNDRAFTAAGAITTDQSLKDDAIKKLREETQRFRGTDGDRGLMVLDNGLKIEPVPTISAKDAQFIESRSFTRDEIATIFGVPTYMVGNTDKATFNNVEQMNIQFVQYSLMPYLTKFEQEAYTKLLTEREKREGYYTKHNVNGLLRGDIKTRFEAYSMAVNNGIMTSNEIRALEDFNKIDQEGADDLRWQLNTSPNDNLQNDNNNE